MRLTLDFNNVMSDCLGQGHGIRPEEVEVLAGRAAQIHKNLQERRKSDIGFYNLPYDRRLLKEVLSLSKKLAKQFDNLVILGIGGSSLGARAIHNALCHPYHNLLPRNARKTPRVFFCDNIDPDSFNPLLKILNLKKTVFNVITKSGETAETVAQFLVIKRLLKKEIGKKYKNHIVITTDPSKGDLRKIANQDGFRTLPIPPNVGGRFSVFSAVGLLPSAVAGVDIEELLAGARQMDKMTIIPDIWKNPAYMSAIVNYLAYQKGKNISVIMPYSSALRDFAEWYIQLWAESLGKRENLKGEIVNIGPTPIKAIGTTDQHAQLQLYMEGPNDKIITFIEVKKFDNKVPIPEIYNPPIPPLQKGGKGGLLEDISYLGGHTMGGLFHAEEMATRIALTKNKRMNYTIAIPELNPFTLGQLLFLFEVQTAFAGGLFEINPFDQPGVEEGKRLTYGMMGKKGYEEKRREVENWPEGNKRYVI